MAELKKLLSALIQGTGSFEQVNTAVQQFLARSPDKAPLVAKLLRAARDAGLPHPMYVSLSSNVTTRIAMGRDPDATVLALDDGGIEADRPAPASSKPMPPSDPPPQTPANDATRFDGARNGTETTADPAAPWEQKTQVSKTNGGDNEATRMEAGLDDHSTRINPDIHRPEGAAVSGVDAFHSDATEIDPSAEGDSTSGGAGATNNAIALNGEVDFDIFSDEALASEEETTDPDTGANWPTIRDPNHPGLTRTFREGDHLRGRFQLLSKLGEGGMGAVWKGKDMLKEEARDRNPFVAIKLLQGDFKEHPEAFIALQRETAKQQRLAHPNIATVYDFDRDDSSNAVFMTMEVLEGQPLDSFIRRLPARGLSVERAMPLIEQLCNGLAYAHSHGLVHADLKPGNCFYTKDGTIKLLDFGIARASKTKADAEGEITLFDPGDFSALTPTYATVEMFNAADPDPRDDIYALAIMTYQLLTGKHPYGKKSAPKAKELGLKPEPISKLNKRQNKALVRGLALEREDRTPTVEEFYESIRPKKSRVPLFAAAAVIMLLVVAVGVYGPARDLVNKYRRDQIISIIEKPGLANLRRGFSEASALGDPEQLGLILNDPRTKSALVAYVADGKESKVNELLSLIAAYDLNWQRDFKETEQIKSAIMNVFNKKIHEAFNVKEGRYDFATASALIAELERLYPDSASVLQRKTQLNQERANELAELSNDYTRYLNEGRLLPISS